MSLSKIRLWPPTAASITDATYGGMPEGQAPSSVNDNVRTQMEAHRIQWEDAEWMNWGHTIAYVSGSEFKATITNTHSASGTNIYAINRRVKLYDSSNVLYGTIISITAAAANEFKVNVALDSGAMSSSLTQVAVAILSTNNSIPQSLNVQRATVSAATITNLKCHTLSGSVIATQAQMETGSSVVTVVTPARVQYSPYAAKAWIRFAADASINSQVGVSSVSDLGVGSWKITWSTAFSTANYAVVVTPWGSAGSYVAGHAVPSDTSVEIWVVNGATGAAADPGGVSVVAYGDVV
jgi:hypothetical protein